MSKEATDPASIGVEEAPEDAIVQKILHAPTPVEKHGQHALPQLDDACIFLCLGRFRCVVCHGVLLGYRRNDERGM
jgi:hypothetical protein